MLKKLINLFYPLTCPICNKVLTRGEKICKQCEEEINVIREPKCQKCGKALSGSEKIYCRDCQEKQHIFDKGVAVFEHKGQIRESIYRFKYNNARVYAEYYADVAVQIYGKLFKSWEIDAIVPVPIYKERELKRGYNQAYVFAKEVSERLKIPLENKLLIRIKNTLPQKELAENMRYLNLKDAFAVNKEQMKGVKNILLVDDIYTTGSTVDACSSILKKAGIKKVYVLCVSAGKDG